MLIILKHHSYILLHLLWYRIWIYEYFSLKKLYKIIFSKSQKIDKLFHCDIIYSLLKKKLVY